MPLFFKSFCNWLIEKLGGHVGPVVSYVEILVYESSDLHHLVFSDPQYLQGEAVFNGDPFVWKSPLLECREGDQDRSYQVFLSFADRRLPEKNKDKAPLHPAAVDRFWVAMVAVSAVIAFIGGLAV